MREWKLPAFRIAQRCGPGAVRTAPIVCVIPLGTERPHKATNTARSHIKVQSSKRKDQSLKVKTQLSLEFTGRKKAIASRRAERKRAQSSRIKTQPS